MKYAIIIPDGAADEPLKELNGKTPIEAAATPNMDRIAMEGRQGLARTVPEGFESGSDVATMTLLGYDPKVYHTGRAPLEAASSVPRDDLNRFTAALGFCDLLSLCLCSGLRGAVQIPLAHPADAASQHAPKVTVSLAGETLRFDQPALAPNSVIHVDGWAVSAPGVLASHRFHWTVD